MKKKIFFAGTVVILLMCLGVYFRPMSLSDLVDEKNTILISASQIGVQNGISYIDTAEAREIENEQKDAILSSAGQCSVNDKTYRMADAAQLIEQIGEMKK